MTIVEGFGEVTLRHLWFDPGASSGTGWALFDDDTPIQMGEVIYPQHFFLLWGELESSLLAVHPKVIGYEEYRIMPKGMKSGYTPVGSHVIPIQVIGVIEFNAWQYGVRTVSQDRQVKAAGYGYAGLEYNPKKKGKGTHMLDAVAHGAWWWMEKGRHLDRTP